MLLRPRTPMRCSTPASAAITPRKQDHVAKTTALNSLPTSKGHTATFGVTKFADWTDREFRTRLLDGLETRPSRSKRTTTSSGLCKFSGDVPRFPYVSVYFFPFFFPPPSVFFVGRASFRGSVLSFRFSCSLVDLLCSARTLFSFFRFLSALSLAHSLLLPSSPFPPYVVFYGRFVYRYNCTYIMDPSFVNSSVPKEWDWRDTANVITPVKNQGMFFFARRKEISVKSKVAFSCIQLYSVVFSCIQLYV